MPPKKVCLFVSQFLIKQTPPTISVIKNAGGVLTVEPSKPSPAYQSTTSETTTTGTTQETVSRIRTTMVVNDDSLPESLRGKVHPKEATAEGTDTDQEPDTDSDYVPDSDFTSDDGTVAVEYEDTLRCHPPLAPEGMVAFIKLEP